MRRGLALALAGLAACAAPPATAPLTALADLGESLPALTGEEQSMPLPKALEAARGLVRARETEGALERAAALLRRQWSRRPDDVETNALLAEVHSRIVDGADLADPRGRERHAPHREAGLGHARQALRMNPDHGPSRYWLGALLLHAADAERSYARLQQAVPELERAHRLSPEVDGAGPLRLLGRVYQETPGFPFMGSTEKAISCYRRALEIAPDHPETRLWLGEAYRRAGQEDLAIEEFRRVLDSKPLPGADREHVRLKEKARRRLEGQDK